MPPYLLPLLMALPLAFVSAAAVRAMIAWPILDHPDARKSHTRPTPKGGGVGPVLAFIIGMLVFYISYFMKHIRQDTEAAEQAARAAAGRSA